jgi:prolyl-tRNA synthetase
MQISNYFLPLIKETPSEATTPSHRLMLRAGMIRQISLGIYSWLPLGLKVLRNVENIIRTQMNKAGCLELLMPTIQPASLWHESGRYEGYGKEMLRMVDRHDHDMLYGPTHEEVITDIFRKNIKSYRDLPKNFYQIQWKFRDEIRPRFGVMRGREFLMKDGYSFDLDFAAAKQTYQRMYRAYFGTFRALGLNAIAVTADSGAIGGDLSHEFHIVADTGESAIYYDQKWDDLRLDDNFDFEKMQALYATADEKHDLATCPVAPDQLRTRRGIEVGHIFHFGTKYSSSMGAYVVNAKGEQVLADMGSYGIGVSRLVGAIIEANHDEAGIIWPKEVAPFLVSLINIKVGDVTCDKLAEAVYQSLLSNNISVLYDDSEHSTGQKFATHDLIGSPYQVTIGPRGALANQLELKNRATGEKQLIAPDALMQYLT